MLLWTRVLHRLHDVVPLQGRVNSHLFALELASPLKGQWPHVIRGRYGLYGLLKWGTFVVNLWLLHTDNMRWHTGSISRTLTGRAITSVTTAAVVRIRPLIMLCLKDGLQRLGRLWKTSRTAPQAKTWIRLDLVHGGTSLVSLRLVVFYDERRRLSIRHLLRAGGYDSRRGSLLSLFIT